MAYSGKRATTRIAKAYKDNPHASQVEIAKLADCSKSTVGAWALEPANAALIKQWGEEADAADLEAKRQAHAKAKQTEADVIACIPGLGQSAADNPTPQIERDAFLWILDQEAKRRQRDAEREDASTAIGYAWTPPIPARTPAPLVTGQPIRTTPLLSEKRPYVPASWRSPYNIGFTPHALQAEFADLYLSHRDGRNGPRNLIARAGRQSGKSEAFAAIADAECHNPELIARFGNVRVLIVCASIKQAKKAYWTSGLVERRFAYRAKINHSDMTVAFPNGSLIQWGGSENAEGIEGAGYNLVIFDEFGIPDDAASKLEISFMPMIGAKDGRIIVGGTPHGGAGDYEKYWKKADGSDPRWGRISWSMIHSPFQTLDVIEGYRLDMDEATFAEQVMGEFVLRSGTCYRFDPARNNSDYVYDPAHPIRLSMDFNVDWFSILVSQTRVRNGKTITYVLDEFRPKGRNSSTDAFDKFMQHRDGLWSPRKHRGGVIVHGDATGGRDYTASKIGYTDWVQVRQRLEWGVEYNGSRQQYASVHLDVPSANPLAVDRVNTVNARLNPLGGVVRALIAPHCEILRSDLLTQAWDEKARTPDKKQERNGIGHMADAFGYLLFAVDPIQYGEPPSH